MRQLTTEQWRKEIGERLAKLRLSKNISQKDLALLAGVSLPSLSKLERGLGVSFETFMRTMRALGKMDWFEGITPEDSFSYEEFLSQNKPVRRRAGRKMR